MLNGNNLLTGPLPTELGQLVQMTSLFRFYSNQLCDDVPTQVQALSSQVTSNWAVTTGNSFGTSCSYLNDLARFPEIEDTTITSIDYNQQGLNGTIPTQVRVGMFHDFFEKSLFIF